MKTIKLVILIIIITSMTFFISGMGCGRPYGNILKMNKELAGLIPELREDAVRIIEKMEIIRLGQVGDTIERICIREDIISSEKVRVYFHVTGDLFDIYESNELFSQEVIDDYLNRNHSVSISENLREIEQFSREEKYRISYLFYYQYGIDYFKCQQLFTQEEIDAINYLLFDKELKLNALSIDLRNNDGTYSKITANFAEDKGGWYFIDIVYKENDIEDWIQDIRRIGDYVEALDNNYYIVFYYRVRY